MSRKEGHQGAFPILAPQHPQLYQMGRKSPASFCPPLKEQGSDDIAEKAEMYGASWEMPF